MINAVARADEVIENAFAARLEWVGQTEALGPSKCLPAYL